MLQISNDILGILKANAEAEEAFTIDRWIVGQFVAVFVVIDDEAFNITQRDSVSYQC